MTMFYVDTGGDNANNSGSSDTNSPYVSGTGYTIDTGATVILSGAPDLSAIPNDGSQSIYIDGATNANRKIFKIVAGSIDNALKKITFDLLPTVASPGTSTWRIGGRIPWPSGSTVWHSEAALLAGDTMQFNNSPASRTAAFLTPRNPGVLGTGWVTFRGKAGVRPVLTITSGSATIWTGAASIGLRWENLEFNVLGTGLVFSSMTGSGNVYDRLKMTTVSACVANVNSNWFQRCEMTSSAADGIQGGTGIPLVLEGCYIHDCGGNGVSVTVADPAYSLFGCLIESCVGRGFYSSSSASTGSRACTLLNCTIWGCQNSGIELADYDTRIKIMNCIVAMNGNAATRYNIKYPANTSIEQGLGPHWHNCFYHDEISGGGNISPGAPNALTLDSSEIITDPLFVSAAGANFNLQSGSPCLGTGFPGTWSGGPTGYMSMGAMQAQVTGGGGGASLMRHPGMNAGFNA